MSSHFEIYNSNQGNIAVFDRKWKICGNVGRSVLAEINPQATRIQPSRAAKNVNVGTPAHKENCQADKENWEVEQGKSDDNKKPAQDDKVNCKIEKESIHDDKKPAQDEIENCQVEEQNIYVGSKPEQDKKEKCHTGIKNVHDDKENAKNWKSYLQENQNQELCDSFLSISDELKDVPMMMDETCMEDPTEDTDYLTSPEYAKDIYLYLRQIENKNRPKWNYMSKQTEVTHSMRSILIDWLVEVATEYKLLPETLHLTISYVDRFMSVMLVQRAKLQLVGVTSMLIAAKVEEVYPPNISDFIYITDDSFTKKQILQMEVLLLKVLAFDLSMPTSHLFVNKYCHMFGLHEKCISLANYINELSLLDGETFLRFSPSILAASSVALARHTLEEQAWTEDMVAMSGYDLQELKYCFLSLQQAFKEADNHPQQSIQSKYRSFRFHNVADIIRYRTVHGRYLAMYSSL